MNRRKNYFIKKKFQAGFFAKFVILLLLEALLIAGLFMFVSRGTLTTAYRGAELTIQRTGAYFFLDFVLITTVVGVGIGIAGIFVFMYLTHRLGGPLYKFERVIEDAAGGDIAQRVILRDTDQLLDIKDQMNVFLEETDTRISQIKDDVEKALELVGKDAAGAGKVKELLEDIKSSLGHFKTSK